MVCNEGGSERRSGRESRSHSIDRGRRSPWKARPLAAVFRRQIPLSSASGEPPRAAPRLLCAPALLSFSHFGTASNLVRYPTQGRILLRVLLVNGRRGLQMQVLDAGPGIQDLQLAMQDGYSTGGGQGSGLPAVRRLMDEFQIESAPSGTRVVVTKWTNAT